LCPLTLTGESDASLPINDLAPCFGDRTMSFFHVVAECRLLKENKNMPFT
jgi:hypothetical protein